jgi:DNA-binding PadR family transcriptional regulator
MIDLAILGLLKEQDLHGYELRRQLGDLSGSRLRVSFGSLYPALNRLERAGDVKAVTHETTSTPPAPMSGSLAGELAAFRAHRRQARARRGTRGKKVYGLTSQGEAHLHELLTAPDVGDDRDFALRLTFCHELTASERLTLFERRRDELLQRREQGRRSTGPGGRTNAYLRSLLERDRAALAADLEWLEELIDGERRALAGATTSDMDTKDTTNTTGSPDDTAGTSSTNTGGQR